MIYCADARHSELLTFEKSPSATSMLGLFLLPALALSATIPHRPIDHSLGLALLAHKKYFIPYTHSIIGCTDQPIAYPV